MVMSHRKPDFSKEFHYKFLSFARTEENIYLEKQTKITLA